MTAPAAEATHSSKTDQHKLTVTATRGETSQAATPVALQDSTREIKEEEVMTGLGTNTDVGTGITLLNQRPQSGS